MFNFFKRWGVNSISATVSISPAFEKQFARQNPILQKLGTYEKMSKSEGGYKKLPKNIMCNNL